MSKSEDWVSPGEFARGLFLTGERANHKAREFAGHGLIKIKVLSASETQNFRTYDRKDWIVPPKFLERWGDQPSRAQIDLYGDRLSSRLPEKLGCGEAKVEAVGLQIEVSQIRHMFKRPDGKSTLPLKQSMQAKPGPSLDQEKWAEFAAALAFIANTVGLDTYKSRSAVYTSVAGFLSSRGHTAIDEKQVRKMIDLARHWVEQGDDPDNWPKGQ